MRTLLAIAACCSIFMAHAIEKDCKCYQFQSSRSKKFGQFKSPMFPRPYPLAISCMLYVFVADQGEIVRLQFEHFELKPRIHG
uniref:CUB domain-containing protein n=1 Tax=Macrostomum lignano TaxID=282301 RepID=A0A1I8J6N2_9PLAT